MICSSFHSGALGSLGLLQEIGAFWGLVLSMLSVASDAKRSAHGGTPKRFGGFFLGLSQSKFSSN